MKTHKAAIVTGGNSGLSRECARALAAAVDRIVDWLYAK